MIRILKPFQGLDGKRYQPGDEAALAASSHSVTMLRGLGLLEVMPDELMATATRALQDGEVAPNGPALDPASISTAPVVITELQAGQPGDEAAPDASDTKKSKGKKGS